MRKLTSILLSVSAFCLMGEPVHAAPLGTAFNYQGRLEQNGLPASNWVYSFRFALYDAASGGNFLGTNLLAVPVTNGLFNSTLDYGANAFTGDARWLEIGVSPDRVSISPAYTTLTPRTRLAPTPYALRATTADTATNVASGAVTAAGLAATGTPTAGQVLTYNGATLAWQSVAGISGAWATNGNAAALGSFLGTVNNVPLDVHANNIRVLRLEGNVMAPNVIAGASGNHVASGTEGATIGGGGTQQRLNGAYTNRIGSNAGYTTIGGGLGNFISNDSWESTIGGGNQNLIQTNAFRSTIAGGFRNLVRTNCNTSTIAGGQDNAAGANNASVGGGTLNHADGSSSSVGGGYDNTASGSSATIAGGTHNRATGTSTIVAGGSGNTAFADVSTIGGGLNNQVIGAGGGTVSGGVANTAAGDSATVPGGYSNVAQGRSSLAAGNAARALHDGSFVWADRQGPIISPTPFESTAPNQFSVRASGGVRFETQYLQVSGAGNEGAYIGGDGVGGEVHLGSLNPATTVVALYNQSAGQYMHLNMKSCTIFGGADLAEPFHMSTPKIGRGSVVVIDPENPGKLKLSTEAYDKRVAGIVSGANGVNPGIALQQQGVLEGGQNVALSGRVYVRADASSAAITPGDLLTTSDMAGHAMKVTDPARAQGAILGKAMGTLADGQGLVLVLVTLQ
jgi:hypothetical protein